MHIYADQISQVTLSNNNLRIRLVQKGPDNSVLEAGTLIIPVNQANNFVNSLTTGMRGLEEKLKGTGQQDSV